MNMILFQADEIEKPILRTDRRFHHIRSVLHLSENDSFEGGIVNGPSGRARITSVSEAMIEFIPEFTNAPDPSYPLTLIVGFPRPIQARRILKDLTTLGVCAIRFIGTDKGEKSYRDSTLWKGEYLQYVYEGAEQACTTRIPEITFHWGLKPAVALISEGSLCVALDTVDPDIRLAGTGPLTGPCVCAIGSERGWSDGEREMLKTSGFTIAGLGRRVLKTETACVSAATLLLSAMDCM